MAADAPVFGARRLRFRGRGDPWTGKGDGSEYVTINPLEGGGTSRLRQLQVAVDAPVFRARCLCSRGPGKKKWESPVASKADGVDKI